MSDNVKPTFISTLLCDKMAEVKLKPPHNNVRSNWATGLMNDINNPNKIVFEESEVVVIHDA